MARMTDAPCKGFAELIKMQVAMSREHTLAVVFNVYSCDPLQLAYQHWTIIVIYVIVAYGAFCMRFFSSFPI